MFKMVKLSYKVLMANVKSLEQPPLPDILAVNCLILFNLPIGLVTLSSGRISSVSPNIISLGRGVDQTLYFIGN